MTSPGFLSFGIVTVTLPLSSTVISGVSLWNVVPFGNGFPASSFTGTSTLVPGLPLPSSYLGVYLSLSLLVTVTRTGTSSFDPSGYVTLIVPGNSSPGFLSSGIVTVTLPLSSTVIPGVRLSNLVPSGIVLPSFSFNGNSTVPPGFPSPSSYLGV